MTENTTAKPQRAPRLRPPGGWTEGTSATPAELDALASTPPPQDIEEARAALRSRGGFQLGLSLLGAQNGCAPNEQE